MENNSTNHECDPKVARLVKGAFDKAFDEIETSNHPATCDQCGAEGTNASMATHSCAQAAKWPCYIGEHDSCAGKSKKDGECPCPCGHAEAVGNSSRSVKTVDVADATERSEARIGLYDENQNLIGYKSDSFWSITKKPENAKTHYVSNGKIEAHLISNLDYVLTKRNKNTKGQVDTFVAGISEINRQRFYGMFETMLVGYDYPGIAPVFTHRVFPEGVEPLSAADSAALSLARGEQNGLQTSTSD